MTGKLIRVDANGRPESPLAGAIALLDLPYGRWSTALARPIRGPTDSAFRAGAKAVVVITNGPSRKVIALNTDGIATWLWLARWASAAVRNHYLAFICNTGHEYEYLGAAAALGAIAPRPAETRLWLHLGANLASRDWHEGTGRSLPSVDTQRYLSVTPSLVALAQAVFAGHPGFEAPYSSDDISAGEQTEILAAGYADVAAVFGIHRYHHVAMDDEHCVSAGSVAVAAAAFQQLVAEIARQS